MRSRILLRLLRPHRAALVVGLLLGLVANATALATPMVTKWVLESLDGTASLAQPGALAAHARAGRIGDQPRAVAAVREVRGESGTRGSGQRRTPTAARPRRRRDGDADRRGGDAGDRRHCPSPRRLLGTRRTRQRRHRARWHPLAHGVPRPAATRHHDGRGCGGQRADDPPTTAHRSRRDRCPGVGRPDRRVGGGRGTRDPHREGEPGRGTAHRTDRRARARCREARRPRRPHSGVRLDDLVDRRPACRHRHPRGRRLASRRGVDGGQRR